MKVCEARNELFGDKGVTEADVALMMRHIEKCKFCAKSVKFVSNQCPGDKELLKGIRKGLREADKLHLVSCEGCRATYFEWKRNPPVSKIGAKTIEALTWLAKSLKPMKKQLRSK